MATTTKPTPIDWRARAAELQFDGRALIGGQRVAAASGETFDCVSPIDARVLTKVARGRGPDVDAAVASARQAFDDGRWSGKPPAVRKKVLQRFSELILGAKEELALLETLDVGKPIRDVHLIDIPMAIEAIAWYAEAADKLYDEVAPTGHDVVAMVTREPMGVVGVVLPWNFPLMLACWKIGPALVAGNTVVIKPAEQSPLTAIRLAELALEAGMPPGVINVVPGFGPTAGKALGLHPDVDALTFTGSGEIGKMFMAYAAQSNMKRVSLECGGKSPNIIFADAPDIDTAARNAAFGIFYNQGEVCAAGSRLVVQESIKDEVLEKVIGWARKMQPGDPLDPKSRAGAIVSLEQTERICGYIAKGSQQGARLALGGKQVLTQTGGFYIEPTIFDGVAGDMTIAREEIFGPVLCILPYDTEEEAIRVANDTPYGLSSYVFGDTHEHANKVGRRIRAGNVHLNGASLDVCGSFGGYKQSGLGREWGAFGFEEFLEVKSVFGADPNAKAGGLF